MKTFCKWVAAVLLMACSAWAAIDAAGNFVKVTVSTGYNAAATSVVLATGDGARLPAAPFNLVWWNSTDYADPSDDPSREIVRVTAVATDTLTVTRAQESTSAATHNTGGKAYKMIGGPTALLLTQINAELAAKINGQDGIATNITTAGVSTNNSPWEVRTIPLTGASISLSFTNGPDFTHSLVAAGADTTITFGNTSGVTNRVLALHCTTDGSHKYNVPDGVYAQTLTNQPFASGFITLTFWIINGRTNYYVSPALVDLTNGVAGVLQKVNGGSGQDNSSVTFPASGILVTRTATETLDNKTLTTPTVVSLVNMNHTHQSAAGGGTLDGAAIAAGTIAKARGGTGADNSSVTFPSTGTIATYNSGEIAALTAKATPVGADVAPIEDSAASNARKKVTLASINNAAFTTLTDGATITWTVNGAQPIQNASVTLGGNRTLAFSGLANGMSGTLVVIQDGTGSRTLTLPATSKVIGGGAGAVTLTTTASAVDVLTWTYDGTRILWNIGKNYN